MKRIRRSVAASIVVEPRRGETIVASISMQIGFGIHGQFGPLEIGLLQRIDELGSLASACQTMNISYRHGWQFIHTINQLFSAPVVVLGSGGRNGGGSHVTAFGKNWSDHTVRSNANPQRWPNPN